MKAGGAESCIWKTQFGFRRKRRAVDTILMARRIIELAWERSNRRILLVALDWSKTFDSTAPQKLIETLLRFGILSQMAKMIEQIYSNRRFFVRNDGCDSEWYNQACGIV